MSDLTVIVLAAGHGKRMRSKLPKPLHQLAGRSMLGHVLHAVEELAPDRVVVVVGHGRDLVSAHLAEICPRAVVAVQEQQLGTGHAARVGYEAAGSPTGDVLVLTADTPLLRGETLRAFVAGHRQDARAVSVLTAQVPDPSGYGRILRGAGDEIHGIVEERDATEEQRAITEINSAILVFDAAFLAGALPRLANENASGEYYLTDTVGLASADGLRIGGVVVPDPDEVEGANDLVQLARLGRLLNRRYVERWMRAGVTVVDPDTTWIQVGVELAPDVTLLPGSVLLGVTTVAEDARIGPFTVLADAQVGAGAQVCQSRVTGVRIAAGASIGPFAHLEAEPAAGPDAVAGSSNFS